MVRVSPPGTLCQNHAVMELVARSGARSFCEIGPGVGELSAALCRRGMTGMGIELSAAAARLTRAACEDEIRSGRYKLIEADFATMADPGPDFDLALSLMVTEHIKDDTAFVARMVQLVPPGGTVIIGVPARMDRWGIDDETVGHYRRYERAGLRSLLEGSGLENVDVRSIAVPVANLTYHLSNYLVRRAGEDRKLVLSPERKTESSGIREIPFKTTFPAAFQLVLNPIAMYPFFLLQRMFYGTGLGLTLVGSGRRPQ
jgi:SAM-dependent methyltransferase